MTVIYQNKLFSLDYDYQLFKNLKKTNPDMKVKVSSLSDSTYTYEEEISLRDIEDWSIQRNLQALRRN